jgi:hypothetical protein
LVDEALNAVGGRGAAIRGVVGHIRWARFPAAVIEGYAVHRSRAGAWSLSATVITANAYNLRQAPLIFVAPTEHGDMTWPIRTPLVGDRPPFRIQADLGELIYEPLRPTR